MRARRQGRVWAAMLLLVLLVGLPVGLAVGVGWPLPRSWPTAEQWRVWLDRPLTRPVLVDTAAVVLWLLWALSCYAVLVDVTRRVARRAGRGIRLPALPTPMQAAAGGMVGVALFGVAHPTPAAAAVTLPVPPAGVAATLGDTPIHAPAGTPPAAGRATATAAGLQWLRLPGSGWLSPVVAALFGASAATVWRRRADRYQPGPMVAATRTDADLTDLPATVQAVQQLLTGDPDTDEPGTPPSQLPPPAPPDGQPPWLGLAGPGYGLTGPGAIPAARVMLTAALQPADTDPADQATQPLVVTTSSVLHDLFGRQADPLRQATGLRLVGGHEEALRWCEAQALHRAAANGQAHPWLLALLPPPPDPAHAARWRLLAGLATAHGLTSVFLGGPGPIGEAHISADGHLASTADQRRLSTLTAAAALDLLALALPPPSDTPPPPRSAVAPLLTPAAVDSPPRTLRLTVLGRPAVHAAGTTKPVRFSRRAAIPLLVLLALHPKGLSTRDIARALWPDIAAHAAAGRVYTLIWATRATLAPLAGGEVIHAEYDGYRLDTQHIEVDLWQLYAAVDLAATTSDPARRDAALHQVAACPVLAEGCGWPFLDRPRETLRRHALDAAHTLAAPSQPTSPAAGLSGL